MVHLIQLKNYIFDYLLCYSYYNKKNIYNFSSRKYKNLFTGRSTVICRFLYGRNQMYRGIFWLIKDENSEPFLLCKKILCDENGTLIHEVQFSSKSGNNLNHKEEWRKFSQKITKGRPYNYYPRGRVEIRKRKVVIYLNPNLNLVSFIRLIQKEFELNCTNLESIRVICDNSAHYRCSEDTDKTFRKYS